MSCWKCGGRYEARLVTYVMPTAKGPVFVEDVPAHVCDRCGDEMFDSAIVKQLEALRAQIEAGTLAPGQMQIGRIAFPNGRGEAVHRG